MNDRSQESTVVVMSGDAVENFTDAELARQVRAIYRAGDGPIHFVATDSDVEPRLVELRTPRREAWLCPECGAEQYADLCDECGQGVAPWSYR